MIRSMALRSMALRPAAARRLTAQGTAAGAVPATPTVYAPGRRGGERWPAVLCDRVLPAAAMTWLAVLKLQRAAHAAGTAGAGGDGTAEAAVRLWTAVLHDALVAVFLLTVAALFLVRRAAVRKAAGAVPRLAALAGAYVATGLALQPPAPLPWLVLLAASALLTLGTVCTIATVFFLGRCFGVLPEARALVTGGPYRFVRHPLYASELLSFLGVAIASASAASALIYALYLGLTLWRVRFEEAVLQEAFPEYAAYRRTTRAFVPGLGRPPAAARECPPCP